MLDLVWKASFKYKNGTSDFLNQYEKDGKENLFKGVLDNQDNLIYFGLLNRNTKDVYHVDLINGCISCAKFGSKPIQPRADMLRKDKYEYRLIYFREVQRDFTLALVQTGDTKIVYFLGFQYVDENGKNHKRIMKIHSDGRVVIN